MGKERLFKIFEIPILLLSFQPGNPESGEILNDILLCKNFKRAWIQNSFSHTLPFFFSIPWIGHKNHTLLHYQHQSIKIMRIVMKKTILWTRYLYILSLFKLSIFFFVFILMLLSTSKSRFCWQFQGICLKTGKIMTRKNFWNSYFFITYLNKEIQRQNIKHLVSIWIMIFLIHMIKTCESQNSFCRSLPFFYAYTIVQCVSCLFLILPCSSRVSF